MEAVLKKCTCCGKSKPKTEDFFRKRGDLKHLFRSSCLICESQKNKEYQSLIREHKKDVVATYKKKYYDKNKNFVKTNSSIYYQKNILKYKEQRLNSCIELKDNYIKDILAKNKAIQHKDLTPEIIETKRLLIKIKRELKNG